MSKLLKQKRTIKQESAQAKIYGETSHDSARRNITIKLQKCTQLNLKHAKHTASIIIPVDMLPRPTCGMRHRMQTFSHRWNLTKTHSMSTYPSKYVDFSPDKLSLERCIACFSLWHMYGLVSRDRNASGCAFTPQSHSEPFHCDHIARRSHREVVGSFRNDRTQWNRCEHGRPVAFRNRSGPKAVAWTRP